MAVWWLRVGRSRSASLRETAELDDKNDEMLVAVAAVTVLVEPN